MKKTEITDAILELFSRAEKPLQLHEISKELTIKSDSPEHDALKEALSELSEQNIVQKSSRRRYSMSTFDNLSTFQGEIKIHEDHGIVLCNMNLPVSTKGKKIVFQQKAMKVVLKRKNLLTALDGDTVLISVLAERKGKKPQGEVIEIVTRKERTITGSIEFDGNFFFLLPNEDLYYVDFLIPGKYLNGAQNGDKVAAKFLQWDNPLKSPIAEVIEIIGKADKPEVGFKSIMNEFSLPKDFSSAVEEEVNAIHDDFLKIEPKNIPDRLDLSDEIIITIDPPDAKDFDDALSLKTLENGNLWLGVHIADVSHYVKTGSETDREALRRGTSVYLVDRVVPMLPEILSNEICSLQPNKIRMAFSVFMEINKYGTVKSYEIIESTIKSKMRFSYDDVLSLIQKFKAGEEPTNEIEKLSWELYKLSVLLRKKRFEKGGVDFETVEVKFELDDDKNPVRAILKQSNEATSLVEECMLMANKTVTEHIYTISKEMKRKETLPFLFRVHEPPNPEKIKTTFRFLKTLTKEKAPIKTDSKTLNSFLKMFADKPEKPIVHQMIVRSMSKAQYMEQNLGHFGLGFTRYTHFTSPIRRYPDLIVHRLIKEYFSMLPMSGEEAKKKNAIISKIGEHSTDRERVAMEAERASVKYSQTVIAGKNIGKIMYGTISGIMNFGVFVNLDDIYAEGLIHIRDLVDDYYLYDEQNFRLIGRAKKRIFQFGDRIKVQIMKSNTEKRKIELKYIDEKKEIPKIIQKDRKRVKSS